MLTKVRERIHKITKAAGVELTLLADHKFSIRLVVLCLDKKTIQIERKQQFEEASLDVLKGILDNDLPVYLALNGRGILHKKIVDSGSDSNVLIQSVLPNAKAQDFYIQNIISEKGSVVSIIRKELADPILQTAEQLKWPVIGFSLGGIVITSVLPLISEATHKNGFTWAGHSIELDRQGSVVDYKSSGNISVGNYYKLDAENLEEDYLVAYAAAFSTLINATPVIPFVEKVIFNKDEYLNKQLFRKASWAVLGFFLLGLMINFLLFTGYSSDNNELVQKERKYSKMLNEMEILSKEVKEKESFLSEAGWLQSSGMTYFADRIAATVPASVKLTELSINPLNERKSKEEKKELFTTGIIFLKGECTRPTELNEWLDKIKLIEKVMKARLVQYTYDNKECRGSFSIEIETEN